MSTTQRNARSLRPFAAVALATLVGSAVAWNGSAAAAPLLPDDSVVNVATGPTGDEFSTSWQLSATATELTGLDPTASIHVDIPPGWQPIGAGRLSLSYSIGTTASGSLSIFVNGDYLDDVALDAEVGAGVSDIMIPGDALNVGSNTIRIVSSIDLTTDGNCRRPSHPGRRVELDENTAFDINMAPTEVEWSDAIAAMMPLSPTERRIDIHTVGPLRAGTLTNASRLVAALLDEPGEQFELVVANHDTEAFTLDVVDPLVPSILIGDSDDLEITGYDGDSEHPGYLSLSRGPKSQPVLVISGIDDDGITVATEAVTSETRRQALSTPELGVPAPVTDSIDATANNAPTLFSLGDLDYPRRTLDGPGRDSTTYGFDLEIAAMPDIAEIRVDAQLSGSSGVAAVGVIVNDERVGVAPFGPDGTTAGTSLVVGGDILRPGRNLVRFDADFFEQTDDCDVTLAPQSVEISPDTTIELGEATGFVALDLDHLPYTFRSPVDTAALTVVLPNGATSEQITSGVLLANLLASTGSSAELALHDDLVSNALGDRHLVLIGTNSDGALHAVFAGTSQSTPETATPGNLGDDNGRATGEIRLIQRYDALDRLILVLTGPDQEGSSLATEGVTNIRLRSDLSGSSAVIEAHPEDPRVIAGETALVYVSDDAASVAAGDDADPAVTTTTISATAAANSASAESDAATESSRWIVPSLLLAGGALALLTIVLWRRRITMGSPGGA